MTERSAGHSAQFRSASFWKHSLGREVLAQLDVLARPLDRLGAVLDHVGVEIHKVMVIMNAAGARRLQIASARNHAARFGARVSPQQCVELAQGLMQIGPRHPRDDVLIAGGGFLEFGLRREQLDPVLRDEPMTGIGLIGTPVMRAGFLVTAMGEVEQPPFAALPRRMSASASP